MVDNEKVAAETNAYKKIPEILSFLDKDEKDNMKDNIEANYKKIKTNIVTIITDEKERIYNDPDL